MLDLYQPSCGRTLDPDAITLKVYFAPVNVFQMRVTKEIRLPFDAYPPIALFLWIISTIHINCIVELVK